MKTSKETLKLVAKFNEHEIEFVKVFGPHANLLYRELVNAFESSSWASVIILSSTIVDIVIYEDSEFNSKIDALSKNKIFSSKNLYWLRNRRNSIVHYEGVTDGLLGGISDLRILEEDAKKSLNILLTLIDNIFSLIEI